MCALVEIFKRCGSEHMVTDILRKYHVTYSQAFLIKVMNIHFT
jgi:hypothetical protein